MDIADKLAIHELLALYGHIIDAQEWDRLDELFCDDLQFDASSFDYGVTNSREELREVWIKSPDHPLAHHATNIVITEGEDGTVRVLSKGLGIGRKGRVGSVTYRDIVRRETGGWRIAQRIATLRQG